MRVALTKAAQRRAVHEGLALGALMSGRTEVHGNRSTLEMQFRAAWRDWPHSTRFPHIEAGPAHDSVFIHVLGRSPRAQSGSVTHWDGQWPFVAMVKFDGWTHDQLAEVIDGAVPAEAWKALVDAWLDEDTDQ